MAEKEIGIVPSYQQTGTRTCPKCKKETTTAKCKACGSKTRAAGKWTVRFRIKAGNCITHKRISGFDTKAEAEGAYLNFKAMQRDDQVKVCKLKFPELIASYLSYQQSRLRESSMFAYKQEIELFVLPYFADKDVFKLTRKHVLEWQSEINQKKTKAGELYSFAKKEKAFERLSALLQHAIQFYDLPVNVARQVGNFRDADPIKKEMQFWEEWEFKQFIAAVDNHEYKTLFTLLYLSGCRKGEVLALTWKDVSFDTNAISITKSMTVKTKSAAYKITATKNAASNRIIYLPESVMQLLQVHKGNCSKFKNFKDTSFVFGLSRPLPPETVRRKFNAYCKKAKVKEIRIHDLRHSHASLLISRKQNILAIAQRLGHSDVEQLLNRYGHLMPEDQKKLVYAIDIRI